MMRRKQIMAVFLISVLLVAVTAVPAAAGSRQRGRWEGFALGLGAAVLGHTLLHHHSHTTGVHKVPVDRHPPRYDHHRGGRSHKPRVGRHRARHYRPGRHRPPVDRHPPGPRCRGRRGHWELQRVWVPPAFKKVWKPGHSGHRGRWLPGCWVKVRVSKGYWKKQRVWVSHR